MTDFDILSALNFRLSEFLSEHSIAVAYPNDNYNPSEGTSYIKVDLLPSETVPEAIGIGSKTRHSGIYQLMVIVPKYNSLGGVKVVVDKLKKFFKMSTTVTFNQVFIRITKFQVNSYREDEVWFYQPVSIYYRSDLENS
jgi:hypothetical protein